MQNKMLFSCLRTILTKASEGRYRAIKGKRIETLTLHALSGDFQHGTVAKCTHKYCWACVDVRCLFSFF